MASSSNMTEGGRGRPSRPWIQVTRQTWKVVTSFASILLGVGFFVLLVLDINSVNPLPALQFSTSAGLGMLFTGVGFIWLCVSVRCRACAGRVAWHLVKTADVNVWAWRLMGISACPLCGDTPGVGRAARSEQQMSSKVV